MISWIQATEIISSVEWLCSALEKGREHLEGAQSRDAAPLQQKTPNEVVKASDQNEDVSFESFLAKSNWWETP